MEEIKIEPWQLYREPEKIQALLEENTRLTIQATHDDEKNQKLIIEIEKLKAIIKLLEQKIKHYHSPEDSNDLAIVINEITKDWAEKTGHSDTELSQHLFSWLDDYRIAVKYIPKELVAEEEDGG